MWPRDGALVAHALDQAGQSEVAKNFYLFCKNVITREGYLLHKYNPDGSLGSSWHPWVDKDGNPQLPIQEDETALVLWALWDHYERIRDVEFIRPLYSPMIRSAGDFLALLSMPHHRPTGCLLRPVGRASRYPLVYCGGRVGRATCGSDVCRNVW